jgi:hypothetical protein
LPPPPLVPPAAPPDAEDTPPLALLEVDPCAPAPVDPEEDEEAPLLEHAVASARAERTADARKARRMQAILAYARRTPDT